MSIHQRRPVRCSAHSPPRPLAKAHLVRLAGDRNLCWHTLHQTRAGRTLFCAPVKAVCGVLRWRAETLAQHNARLIEALTDRARFRWAPRRPDRHCGNPCRSRLDASCMCSTAGATLVPANTNPTMHELAGTGRSAEFDADIFKLLVRKLAESGGREVHNIAVTPP